MTKPKIIFFGNGPLADYALPVLAKSCEIVFHAHSKEDLEQVKALKTDDVCGILASFGVIIKQDVLDLFEPAGILNIHPSMLPKYRGPSPIETAILNGDTTFGVSVMKLAAAMDAGPIYYQNSFDFPLTTSKNEIYRTLSEDAATWIAKNLNHLATPVKQDDKQATYTKKLDKSLSPLDPSTKSAQELLNQIRAFAGFPKSKYTFFDLDCTIISAHVATSDESASINHIAPDKTDNVKILSIHCYDGSFLIIDQIQPAGRKIMDAKSFINGYGK